MKDNTSEKEFSQQPFFLPESHSFDTHIAIHTNSVIAALLFDYLGWYGNEDRTWKNTSPENIKKHFPYLSTKQIKNALLRLVKTGCLDLKIDENGTKYTLHHLMDENGTKYTLYNLKEGK